MKIRKPDYYDRFSCIGGACDFTCCQQWKIGVDDKTNAAWKRMAPPEGMKTGKKNLSRFTVFKDGARVVALEDHMCPFLDPRGLCRLVTAYGEESLSLTCHTFPRESHDFGDRRELTLMPACPVIVDFLQEAEAFHLIETSDEAEAPKTGNTDPEAFRMRDLLLELCVESEENVEITLQALFFVALSMESDPKWSEAGIRRDLPELYRTVKGLKTDTDASAEECNELFLDLVANYREKEMYQWLLEEKAQWAEVHLPEQSVRFAEAWNHFTPLLKKWLAQEIYADCLIPEGDTESILVRLQWIAMEYVLMRQLCLLHLQMENRLEYTDLRNYLVLTSRLMGYEEEDIYDYMESAFESLVWEWGYLALLMGNK